MVAEMGSSGSSWLHRATSNGVPQRSLAVALVVGSVLNMINQWDALFGDAAFDLVQLCLNFVVPYLVATYGAITVRRDAAANLRSDNADD